MNDHLGHYPPDPKKFDATDPAGKKAMSLVQCFCDACKNSFYVDGASPEYLPKQCCYCGGVFGEVEEIKGEDNPEDLNDQWGYELFA